MLRQRTPEKVLCEFRVDADINQCPVALVGLLDILARAYVVL